jgi:hypothetical protein
MKEYKYFLLTSIKMTPKEMTPEELVELTHLMDTYNYENETTISPLTLHHKWWPFLNELRRAPNKEVLLEGWKYKKELESAEYSHINSINTHISLDNWEQRFVVDLWLSIYH